MQVVKDFFIKHNINASTIAVGVSGGADSLALVLLLKESLPQVRIVALTVDHGLRPTSYDEALYVKTLMKKHDIEHHILTWKGEKPTTGIEEQARVARYNLLTNWCQDNNVNYLAIAHHLYDQAETFLMRIHRGSGLLGLSSMDEISVRDNIYILRPLLDIHPCDLKKYLNNKNINWVEDESNNCDDFLRVKMRKFLPVLEKEVGISPLRLSLTAKNLQKTKSFLDDSINSTIKNQTKRWKDVAYSFDYSVFLDWHDEIKFHVLGRIIKELSGLLYTPEAEVLLSTITYMNDNNFDSITLGGCIILKQDLKIWIIKEYRDKNQNIDNVYWDYFIKQNPEFRGIKIPHKLKIALLKEKK